MTILLADCQLKYVSRNKPNYVTNRKKTETPAVDCHVSTLREAMQRNDRNIVVFLPYLLSCVSGN